MRMFPADIKPERGGSVPSRDFHLCDMSRMLLFEKPVKHFQKQGFGSMYGIGEFRISPQHSVQVDFLCDHVVAAIQLSRCARHSERQVRKLCDAVNELDVSFQIRQHRLQIGPVLLLALFTPCSCAKFIDLVLGARLEIRLINSKISGRRDFLLERSLARWSGVRGEESVPRDTGWV